MVTSNPTGLIYRVRASSYDENEENFNNVYGTSSYNRSVPPQQQVLYATPNARYNEEMANANTGYANLHQLNANNRVLQQQQILPNADRFTSNRQEWSRVGPLTTSSSSQEGSTPASGSQTALVKHEKQPRVDKWPKGKDFLFAVWAFTIGAPSLWELPVLTLRYGGVVFLLVYVIVFLLIGVPMLILELALGQYSAMTPSKMLRNLCPTMNGVGLAMVFCLALNVICDLAVLVWSCQALHLLFFRLQHLPENFFYSQVLDISENVHLLHPGQIHGQLVIALALLLAILLLLLLGGVRIIGKVSMLTVPLIYALLVSLTLRALMASGGGQGMLALLKPDWSHAQQPYLYLEAIRIVIISTHLAKGVLATLASHNKFHHNFIRDTGIIALGHLLYSVLCVLMVLALLGVAHEARRINLDNMDDEQGAKMFITIVGKGFWMLGVTLAESALETIDFNFIWSGLLFALLTLTTFTTALSALHTLLLNVLSEFPGLRPFRILLALTIMAGLFMLNLALSTEGGIHIYYLLQVYGVGAWPGLMFALCMVWGAAFAHGGKYLMKDMAEMSKIRLSHYAAAHLSVLYATIIPFALMASLVLSVYTMVMEHVERPLINFSMGDSDTWGVAIGWSLAILPILIALMGLVFHLLCRNAGMPFHMHWRRSLKPTDEWYENEHRELLLSGNSEFQTLGATQATSDYRTATIIQGLSRKNVTEV